MKIADRTLCLENSSFSFKEKIEIIRNLDKVRADIIELPAVEDEKIDVLLVRTVSSFVKDAVLSVSAGEDEKSIQKAVQSLSVAAHPRIRIELPVSTVGMEYGCRKKPAAMLSWISEAVRMAVSSGIPTEFCALDATRAEMTFLQSAVDAAWEAGASFVSVCDSAGEILPDEFASLVRDISRKCGHTLGISCDNTNGMAAACAAVAVRSGHDGKGEETGICVDTVKTAVNGSLIPLDVFADILRNCGRRCGMESRLRLTDIHRTVNQISRICGDKTREKTAAALPEVTEESGIALDAADDPEALAVAASRLGYDLSGEDLDAVYREFLRVAEKKRVGARELDAIVSGVILQARQTYVLKQYMISSSSVSSLSSSAQIALEKDGEPMQGISIGDGPIDAAFVTLEQMIGRHFELDDFRIRSITEGKEAIGSATVTLRSGGRLYRGSGLSTDIIGASIRAYLNAVNKIVFEEA